MRHLMGKLLYSLQRKTFENNMPYGQYKKTFPPNYSPPALMVYYFQEISGFHSGGYNLPNFDDIRRDVGAKNIIKLNKNSRKTRKRDPWATPLLLTPFGGGLQNLDFYTIIQKFTRI